MSDLLAIGVGLFAGLVVGLARLAWELRADRRAIVVPPSAEVAAYAARRGRPFDWEEEG